MPSFGSVGLAFSSTCSAAAPSIFCASSAVSTLRSPCCCERSSCVSVALFQLPCRSGLPSAVRGTFHPAAEALTTHTTDRILPNRTRAPNEQYFIVPPRTAHAAPEQCMEGTQRDN